MCLLGWEGDGFECSNIDECATGTHNCPSNSQCEDEDGGFTCSCLNGFEHTSSNTLDGTQCVGKKDIFERPFLRKLLH